MPELPLFKLVKALLFLNNTEGFPARPALLPWVERTLTLKPELVTSKQVITLGFSITVSALLNEAPAEQLTSLQALIVKFEPLLIANGRT